MNTGTNAIVAKVMGWTQFVFGGLLPSVLGGGLPTGGIQWAAFIGSLLTAIGIHASSKTDGQK